MDYDYINNIIEMNNCRFCEYNAYGNMCKSNPYKHCTEYDKSHFDNYVIPNYKKEAEAHQ